MAFFDQSTITFIHKESNKYAVMTEHFFTVRSKLIEGNVVIYNFHIMLH